MRHGGSNRQKGENVMVNATQMAKPFGKSAKDFLKTDQTKRFISALSEVKKILLSDLMVVTKYSSDNSKQLII